MAKVITRCAIYTRKSSEEGLEQSFNSFHAQREACEAFVLSQRHEGWSAIGTQYDDGGFSGGTMDRPGLKTLLADIDAGKVDVVMVYKIDRLTRSLSTLPESSKRLIVAAHASKANPDAVLIKAIVRAHQWFEMLKQQTVSSITEIAKAEHLPRTYISSVIPFALLAPDITSAILDGTQPIDLNLDRLISRSLPLDWAEQRSVLGFK
jgi:hypothetical protein